jgi:N-methylhydantoinase A
MAFDFVQTYLSTLRGINFAHLNTIFAEMEARGRALLRQAGVLDGAMTVSRSADMRYLHQGFEINVPVEDGRLDPDDIPHLQANFDRAYERLYKRLNPNVDVEALNWRVIVSGPRPTIRVKQVEHRAPPTDATSRGARPAYFPEASGYVSCQVYDRYQLAPGMTIRGPAIIEERESTVVVAPKACVEVDVYQNVVIWLPSA